MQIRSGEIKQGKVSIVIPVYKVESYLPECIESVLSQTYTNLEIFLIDDGSPDRCPMICDEYAKADARVKTIHKVNGGAASARNVGLDCMTGEYLCFVDSDDVVENQYVEKLLANLCENHSDIAVCSYKLIYKNTEKQEQIYEKTGAISQVEFLERFLIDWRSSLIWNKIFKASLVGDLRMEEGHKIDDEFFTYQLVMNAEKVSFLNEYLYGYRIRKSSVMQTADHYYERILNDKLSYVTIRYVNVVLRYPQLRRDYTADLIDNLIRLNQDGHEYPDFQKKVRNWVYDHKKEIFCSPVSPMMKLELLRRLLGSDKKRVTRSVSEENDKQLFE